MSQLRNTLPALISVGIGYCGYRIVYKVKQADPVQIDDGITVIKPWKIYVYSHLPLNSLSRLWGRINSVQLPVWARKPVCRTYAWLFNCNLSEMAVTDFTQYRNLSEFFRRHLKPSCRPVDAACSVTCPSDGTVIHYGKVSGDQIEQVKGVTYSLQRFLGPPDWNGDGSAIDTEASVDVSRYLSNVKQNGAETELYQATIYLAPGDYHRFHSPTEWNVIFRRYFPGLLLSVSPSLQRSLPGLFCLNERVAYVGQWKHGFMALVAVGATNVGSIRVFHDQTLQTNTGSEKPGEVTKDRIYRGAGQLQPVTFSRGDSFGEFNLGSTIVVLFEAPKSFKFALKPGQKVKYGQVLGH